MPHPISTTLSPASTSAPHSILRQHSASEQPGSKDKPRAEHLPRVPISTSPRPSVIDNRTSSDISRQPSSHSRFASISLLRSRRRTSGGSLTPQSAAVRSDKDCDTTITGAAPLPRASISDKRNRDQDTVPLISRASQESLRASQNTYNLSGTTLLPPSNNTTPTAESPSYQEFEEAGITWAEKGVTPPPEDNIAQQYKDVQQVQRPKMHQTSSRLLRMTDDDRPFTRDQPANMMTEQDFKDLFSTLMVSLPLTPHRVRFTKIEHTFTTDEAITNLGSLKFSQSNRMPDPKDPSRIVTTTTTTTFSMAKEMARSVCTKFVEARFIESLDGKTDFSSKSSVWQLSPKGMRILSRFCQRNGIHQRHVNELLDSPRNMMQLVILERESDTDKLNHDRATVEVIFRRFVGETGPNLKTNSNASDSDSINEYATGLVGVRMTRGRPARGSDREASYVFTGKAATDWLMDCCTVVDRRECFELASLFMQYGLIAPAVEDRHAPNGASQRFQNTKNAQYVVTEKGMRVAGWVRSPNGSVNGEATATNKLPPGMSRDSNTSRMTVIIRDPALRLLFREFLSETHCEENLSFYLDVTAFLRDYEIAKRAAPTRIDLIRETLAAAYSLYNAFLAPGSPCELNIDHNLRNALAGRMTRAVGEDEEMVTSLDEVASLFDQAQNSVFKLMASDSVPKFSRDPKYSSILRDRNLEHLLTSFSATSIS